ncbi:hypothetical protein M0Q28_05550 [Patescibacteria group bacterium]|jgi:hypothetical protein|nr:hypothetical protein [Patescibacteria group bacterium]
MSPRSDFSIVKNVPGEPLVILDRNLGNMSVTNDAEAVVESLTREGLLPAERRLFYYDSDGGLDEITHKNGVFTGFLAGTKGGK